MTPEELLASLPDGYTKGPWRRGEGVGNENVVDMGCPPKAPYAVVYSDGPHEQKRATRDLIAAAPALVDALRAVVAERDELAATLANERGEGEPPSEGWEWRSGDRSWSTPMLLVLLHEAGWGWCFRKASGRKGHGIKTEPTARAAMIAADKALGGGK